MKVGKDVKCVECVVWSVEKIHTFSVEGVWNYRLWSLILL